MNIKVHVILKPSKKELGIFTLETESHVSSLISISLLYEVLESDAFLVAMTPVGEKWNVDC
jgi:hypothetical protein